MAKNEKIMIGAVVSEFNYDITMLGWGSSSAAYDPSGSKALYLSSGQYHQWYPEQPEPATEWEAEHDDIVIQQASRKIADLAIDYDKPVGLGISGPGMSRLQAQARIERAKSAVEAVVKLHRRLRL